MKRSFASDNNAGAHPEVLAALARVNQGHVRAYGDDPYTAAAVERLRGHLGERAEIFFVFGGTGANVLGLHALMRPHEAVICSNHAHIQVDECGAPERFVGCKLLGVPAPSGKLTPDAVLSRLVRHREVWRELDAVVRERRVDLVGQDESAVPGDDA